MNSFLIRTLRIPSLLLAAALQLVPIVRVALPTTQSAANIIVILFRWCAGTAAALGGVQAVSGGSTVITCPKQLQATNGVPFSQRLTTAPHLSTYWVANSLPPGLEVSGKGSLWYLAGTPSAAGTYSFKLTAKEGATSSGDRVVSSTITMNVISVEPQAPSIVGQPAGQTVHPGENCTLTVSATGFPPPAYQWHKNGAPIPAETNPQLHLTSVTSADAGQYFVVVSNSEGMSVSSTVTVAVSVTDHIAPGTYIGLFYDAANPTTPASGLVSLKLTDAGSFSGTVQVGRKKSPLRGSLTADGNATNEVAGVGILELHANYETGNQLVGRVVGDGWTAALSTRVVANAPGERVGSYTLVIPGAENGTIAPLGDGFAGMKVLPNGATVISGMLADGTRLVARTFMTAAGEVPVYASLYSGRGAAFGWLRVRPSGGVDLDGELHWIRPAGPVPKLYPAGFTLKSGVLGSVYSRAPGSLFNLTAGRLLLTGGDFDEPLTDDVTFGANAKVTGTGPDKLALRVASANGLFKGAVTPVGGKPVRIQGVVLQKQGYGSGFFLGSAESGHVYLGE